MREEFFTHLWTLTQLRYRLIWAQTRTSNGRIILLLSLYLLGGSGAILMAFGGLGAAIVDSDFNQGGSLARWTLSALFINGIILSLMFGVGTQEAFSEESLRRYPLKAKERFIIRQIIGLLDPIWAFIAAGALGLAVGFSWFGRGVIVLGALAAALFVAASYLATVCLLSLVSRIMRSRAASSALGIIVLALISFGPLALLAASEAGGVWRLIGQLLLFTPPGAAAAMMAEDRWHLAFGAAALLVIWVAALTLLLKKLESLRPGAKADFSGGISWDGFYDQIAGLFGRQYAPLVSKSLRYHLRCNLVRFSLLTSPLLVLFAKFLALGRSARGEVIITLALFFMTSSAISVSMALNLFGYDGAGIRRYAVLPSTFATALRADSLASLLLRAGAMLAAVALWIIFAQERPDARMLLVILGIAGAGLFLFNALGLWTSVLSPKAANFNSIWSNRLSFGAINLLGERFTSDSVDLKRRIGVMPEGLALFDHLYAHEFLAFSARMYQLDEQTVRRRVEELLTVLDLTSAYRKRLAEFSTGMRKKVAFAAAIIHRPDILFLDEPFESIDPAGVAMLKEWLRRFVAGGRTVFMTTHALETVERLCDDVAIIKSGRVAWRGDVGRLANGGKLECDGRRFDTLEALFLHLAGEKHGRLEWL